MKKKMASFGESVGFKNDYFSRLEMDDEDGNEFTDRWNTGELLCLASAVQRSGDKNWVSVSRAIKPLGEAKRPADWCTPKHCALQYSKLLRGVEDFKKKTLPRTERETSEELLVKNLTDKRIIELNWLNQQTKVLANSLKVHMEMLEAGEYDDHLDELLKQIEEQEKKEEEDLKEWIARRDALNAAKKLNKCRVPLTKGKAVSRGLDSKRKNSPNPDHIEDASLHSSLADIVIKTEVDTDNSFSLNTKPIQIKQEIPDAPSCISSLLEGIKASNVVPPSPLPTTPTSPLLTSLLRSTPSSNATSPVVSYVSSPLKEVDAADSRGSEIDMAALISKSQETSPRASASHSPRPTPSSSPLLNSLLKNTPSSVSPLTSLQLVQNKDPISSKVVSSPQTFFNPTSALATAAAQQLAVATSSLSQSHVFFPQETSESQKRSQSSPVTSSACLSAPTLSKLLEMPPSTPGRLPPLPVVETMSNTVTATSVSMSEQTVMQSPKKVPTATMLLNELELQIAAASPSKKPDSANLSDIPVISDPFVEKKLPVPISIVEKKPVAVSNNTVTEPIVIEQKTPVKRSVEKICLDVFDSINHAFDDKESKQEVSEVDLFCQPNLWECELICKPTVADPVEGLEVFGPSQKPLLKVKAKEDLPEDNTDLLQRIQTSPIPDEIVDNVIGIDKLISISSSSVLDETVFLPDNIAEPIDLDFHDDKQKTDVETINALASIVQPSELSSEAAEEEKAGGRKFYKCRTATKKRTSTEEDAEKLTESHPAPKHGIKRPFKPVKPENEVPPQIPVNEQILLAAKEAEEATLNKSPEKSPTKSNEIRSPVAKKPRLFEKTMPKEKKELSEDETPIVKRPGRKAKKGRKMAKSTPVKQDEPKDQYEFSESTEENSVGYQAANTLCYMPRLKDDIRCEDSKTKQTQPQVAEDTSAASSAPEKKHVAPVKNKPGRPPSVRKNLFTSDEERMSDSMTSDDASNSQFGDDKLKKWKEFSEKKELPKENKEVKSSQKETKLPESPKKKSQHTKRPFPSKSDLPKKEKKNVPSDVEVSSVCSRDSEDVGTTTPWQGEGETNDTKDTSSNVSVDVEAEANDSRMSSSMTVESDNKMDEMEGYESLQGSVTTEFSPVPQSDVKEDKDMPQFGKQDWYQGTSPKSCSEHVSHSSEESEYESDNWDNQSVSTNKSASHSAGHPSKRRRKERETTQNKAWKKAISIVLREASCHKYANVFLQKVTNDVAPGYLNIVYRPMDLSLLKKNVDNGVVKTTPEVHRDMLLMFQNAVMYNSSDHDVHMMAVEMQRDVIQQIQAFLTTQFNDKGENNELTSLRAARAKSQKGYASVGKTKEEGHDKE